MPDAARRVLVRPRRSLLTTALLSIALVMIPVFGSLYWFAAQHGSWLPVFIAHLIVVALCFAVLFRQLSVYTAIDDHELSGRGIFSPMVRVPLESIASVHLVRTYVGQSSEPVRQLLVSDAQGRRLFRLRGSFWHPGDLDAVAAALPVEPTIVREPMSLRDFFRAYPGSAYWFEDRPVLGAVLTGLVFVGVIALTIVVMWAMGIPLAMFRG
ncbi:MAG TPA: hypothetical protein VN759_08795 [Pseudolysinimonas sp.]|nr:hypothetical protein [Pseudolysinimonas sp.]